MTEKNWKNHLLKSGLPFEYEVKECFVKHGCTVWDEYSYIKSDENNLDKEFSYDIDVNYWDLKGDNSFTFMVECKYKTEPTKWFFLPDPYAYQNDLTSNSFLHTIDYFSNNKFLYKNSPYDKVQEPLGPFCLKGVEVYQNQFLETNIYKAISQLSYAFIEQAISSIQSQLENSSFFNTIFFNIPVIITNAELYIINKKITTADIEKAKEVTEVSEQQDFLLFHNKTSESLRRHNKIQLMSYFAGLDKKIFDERNKSFSIDIPHFVEVLSQHYSPEVVLIMHHDKQHENYQKLFNYIDFMLKPSQELESAKKRVKDDLNNRIEKFSKDFFS